MQTLTISRFILSSYLLIWAWLVYRNLGIVADEQLREIVLNAIVISSFVGLGLNVNAFSIQNRSNKYQTLGDRIVYVKTHLPSIAAFFLTPFCVSTASGFALASENQSLVFALFGTNNYFLVMEIGFIVFILLPTIYIYHRHG